MIFDKLLDAFFYYIPTINVAEGVLSAVLVTLQYGAVANYYLPITDLMILIPIYFVLWVALAVWSTTLQLL